MKIFKQIKPLKKAIRKYKTASEIIGFVPTMGALHRGHLALIKQIKKQVDVVIVSIFINPKQFNNLQDYQQYPKNPLADIEKLKAEGIDILFIPDEKEIYPPDFATNISLDLLAEVLCGKTRPGHFEGVAMILTKLFNLIEPDLAIFGKKDFQQLQIIRKLQQDLNINVKIISAPIIREKSGLALSSRNLRLDDNSKKIAPIIYRTLSSIKQQLLAKPESLVTKIIQDAKKKLIKSGFEKIDYLEICNEKNLQPVKKFNPQVKSRIFIAVYLKQIRLIDNLSLYTNLLK